MPHDDNDAVIAQVLRDHGHEDIAEALEAKGSLPEPTTPDPEPEPTEAEAFVKELQDRNEAAWSTSAAGLLEG